MPAKPRVLIDLKIILDVLQKRDPFYETSARLLALVEAGRVEGYLTAHSLTTLFYLIRKDKSAADARAVMTELLQFIEIAPVERVTIERAINLDYRDFEDAVQMSVALQIRANYLITCNAKDYQPALVAVLQPVDFLGTL